MAVHYVVKITDGSPPKVYYVGPSKTWVTKLAAAVRFADRVAAERVGGENVADSPGAGWSLEEVPDDGGTP